MWCNNVSTESKQFINDTTMADGSDMDHMASSKLAVIIAVPLAVLLVISLLAIYCVYHWSYCRIRGVTNDRGCCGMATICNYCINGVREGSDGHRNDMLFTDLITPEAIIPQGKLEVVKTVVRYL